ncbi:hypothetical protein A3C59_03650 [Candidatus Daviesbacteria bacterium RIFCSPHIGHO2_02_FULL_36_13]|uniref:Uncharacterized protein n=1 Tax=Candidatus Daviesbacteria bacterium RIFCSPHIGHO2_02_FULL_36_13 TaxID=1797768 RepID=A0A1F5JX06_9BACT|nr:MAG: hypothetical protein A3C59_03650 [Candidatus Daviesbacteria bacterium RIFCSPHIGHO2_02_FULL_36_13]
MRTNIKGASPFWADLFTNFSIILLLDFVKYAKVLLMPYLIIVVVVLIVSPFILKLAQSQKKEDKRTFRNLLLFILAMQIGLGVLNWENFTAGRSGFELAFIYPSSLLGLFFITSISQIILLMVGKSFSTLVVILNFINSVLIFTGMIRLSNILGFQAVSFASIGSVFLVLLGNIIGLNFINKDKNLLKKYFK